MGRYGGARGAMKKNKKRIARRLGVPGRRVNESRVEAAMGLRFEKRGAKPGFSMKIRQPRLMSYGAFGEPGRFERLPAGTVPDFDKALKKMKHWDPKLGTAGRRRRPYPGKK